MQRKRIALLGAGIAGLATAYRVAQSNNEHEIIIFEKESRPGGLARSVTIAGIPSDYGPHRINTELGEIKTFLREFLGSGMFTVKRRSQMFLNGRFIEYPIKFFDAIRHLGLYKTVQYGFSAIVSSMFKDSRVKEHDTFETVMKKALGSALYNDIIRPYSEKTWKTPPENIDAEVARVRLSGIRLGKVIRSVLGKEQVDDPSALRQFFYLDGGIESLVNKFVASYKNKPIKINTNATVTALSLLESGKIKIGWIESNGKEHQDIFDFCFSSIPLDELVRMLTRSVPDENALSVANKLRYISMIIVYVVANKPQISPNSWMYFPEKEFIFNRGYEPKNFFRSMPAGEQSVLCLEITCFQGDELWQRDDSRVAEEVVRQICSTGLLKPNEVVQTEVVRLTHAYPLLTTGYKEQLKIIWQYLSQIPSLITVGRQGLFQHNNIDHSIYGGFCAGDLYLRSSSPVNEWYTTTIKKFQNFRIID
ncbi:NAD(P)-binding protein [Candidatus Sumerlaeota bacterium]|nr:NAD(P)-binding protein [Candidatus Sumerlaeota bacterium]